MILAHKYECVKFHKYPNFRQRSVRMVSICLSANNIGEKVGIITDLVPTFELRITLLAYMVYFYP